VAQSLIGAPDIPRDLVRHVMTPLDLTRAAPTSADVGVTSAE
jgi:hypothetical protein